MAGEYPITRVGDLAFSVSDTHKFGKEKLIFLNTSDILYGKFLHRTYSAVKGWPGQAKKLIRKGDILFSEIRPANGRWAFVEDDADDYVVSTKLMVIRARKDRVFPKFLYHYLTSAKITSWLQHLAESRSGTFPQITFDEIVSLELPLPPIPEQKTIAHILGTLDDKIELNRRMNETLEQMAQAIFKSWFVDFEFPGHDKTEFVNGLPNGWRKGCLGDILAVSIGGDWGGDHEFEGAIRAISLRGTDLETLKLSGFAAAAPIRWIRKDKLEKRMVNDCDILIGGSGLGPIGKTLYCSECLANLYDLPVTYSNFCRRLTAKSKDTAVFAEIVLENMYLSGEMRQFYTGTSIPNLDVNSLLKYPILIPAANIVSEFYKIASGKFAKLFNKENVMLAQIRDSLLPKLMSGKLLMRH